MECLLDNVKFLLKKQNFLFFSNLTLFHVSAPTTCVQYYKRFCKRTKRFKINFSWRKKAKIVFQCERGLKKCSIAERSKKFESCLLLSELSDLLWRSKKLLLEIFKAELPHPVDTCVFALNLIALSRICIWEWTKGLQVVYYYQNAFEV